jgi:hypothetical protein
MSNSIEFHPEQEVFIIYLHRQPPVSPVLRMDRDDHWQGSIFHIPSGTSAEFQDINDLVPTLKENLVERVCQPRQKSGLK